MILYPPEACCEMCGESTQNVGWSLHEMWPDEWAVVCDPCEEALELDQGK